MLPQSSNAGSLVARSPPRVLLCALLGLSSADCGPSVSSSPVTLGDGRQGIEVECWFEQSSCAQEAQRACPTGYRIAEQAEHYVPNGGTAGGRTLYTMTIECASVGR